MKQHQLILTNYLRNEVPILNRYERNVEGIKIKAD